MTKTVLVVGRIVKRNGRVQTATARSSDWQCPLVSWGTSIVQKGN